MEWEGLGIISNGEHLTHLRFADNNIVILADPLEELSAMRGNLHSASQWVGRKISKQHKVRVSVTSIPVVVDSAILEVVDESDEYIYLRQLIRIGNSNRVVASNSVGQRLGNYKVSSRLVYLSA